MVSKEHLLEHISFAKEMNVPNTVKVQNGDIVRLSQTLTRGI